MPWSPVPMFPKIIKQLKESGYLTQVNMRELRKAVIMNTGLVKDKTIANTIKIMVELGFLTEMGHDTFYIGKYKSDDSQIEAEIDKRMEELTNDPKDA